MKHTRTGNNLTRFPRSNEETHSTIFCPCGDRFSWAGVSNDLWPWVDEHAPHLDAEAGAAELASWGPEHYPPAPHDWRTCARCQETDSNDDYGHPTPIVVNEHEDTRRASACTLPSDYARAQRWVDHMVDGAFQGAWEDRYAAARVLRELLQRNCVHAATSDTGEAA